MRKFLKTLLFPLLFVLPLLGQQTVTVTADLKTMFGAAQTTQVQVCFSLTDANGAPIPDARVTGTGVLIATSQQCLSPDGSGHISTTMYANDQINPAGTTYYVQYQLAKRSIHGDQFIFNLADGTENLNTKLPITTVPLIVPPGGDATYLRLDGTNQPLISVLRSPIVAKVDLTAQSTNVPVTTLYAVPANGAGLYRVSCYVVLTTAAGTSSTLPACNVQWFDNDTGISENAQPGTTSTANTVGTNNATAGGGSQSAVAVNVKASTNFTFNTAGYASSPANAMQFAVHVKLEYLGN